VARKLKKLTGMHTHQLLCNLRAMEKNAVNAPVESRASYAAGRDAWAPQYRAELESRGVKYPTTLDEADWEIALAKALGYAMPPPRKFGRYVNGKIVELTQVWDPVARCYETRQ
jgi:hypothetical protein